LCLDPQNRVWFQEGDGNKLGMLDPAPQKFAEYPLPTPNSYPEKCIYNKDAIWLTEFQGNKIAAFYPSNMSFKEYSIPTPDSWPRTIVVDSAKNIWFNELQGNKIGRLALYNFTLEEWSVPTPSSWLISLAVDQRDKVWFTEYDGNKIGSLIPPTFYAEFSALPQTPLTVDGKTYDALALPLLFKWETGSVHSVSLTSKYNINAGSRYAFEQWSDGKISPQREIKVSGYLILTANGNIQYLLQIVSNYGDPSGAGWYDAETNVTIAVKTPFTYNGSSFLFERWTGDLASDTPNATIIVDSPKQITAIWQTQTTPAQVLSSQQSAWPLLLLLSLAVVGSIVVVQRTRKTIDLSHEDLTSVKVGSRVIFEPFGRMKMQIQEILEGNMGIVYVCKDKNGRRFAVKTFHPWASTDQLTLQKLEKRFYNEAALWIGLGTHENIVRAINFANIRGRPFLLLEYVEGSNLRHLINSERMDLRRALTIARDISSGLSYAHSKRVLHRDLKPENILIGRNGIGKVTDFGLAKIMLEESGTISQDLAGTLSYMSPEQFSSGAFVDERSDIYSFGVVVHELLTGERPFRIDSIAELIKSQREYDRSSPILRSKSVPAAIETMVLKCLRNKPGERFESFNEIQGILEEAIRKL
jgi:hypothetical protein